MCLAQKIDPEGWYPMETFERLGVAILKEVALGQLDGVRMWGRFQVPGVRKQFPMLVADGEPRETMMRFGVLADSFFDYGALGVESVTDDQALDAQREFSRNEGLYIEPSTGVVPAALDRLLAEGHIHPGETVVALICGGGFRENFVTLERRPLRKQSIDAGELANVLLNIARS